MADDTVRDAFSEVLERKGELLAQWLNEHGAKPALLHGDLWPGNVLFDQKTSWLIDPAAYFGDPEADLAMTELFGGFGKAFYEAYGSVRARTTVYSQKRDIYNGYHYLNHFNVFGAGYLRPCEKVFRRIADL